MVVEDEVPLKKPTLAVLYSCHACGLSDVACPVPERGKDQDIKDWFEGVMIAELVADHERRSPTCVGGKLNDIKIPIEGVDRLGDVPRS